MDNKIKFCKTCNDEVKIELGNTTLKGEVKGDCYLYKGIEPSTECGHFIPDEEIDKHNLKILHDTYRDKNDLISLEKIRELPTKYDIGKRPLSNLLQWGELTFTRYFNGDIPSKAYSEILKDIYNNPQKFLDILETNQEHISHKTYEKSKNATENLLQNTSKINDITDYIIYQSEDITPQAVQKLLYYSLGFHFAFFETILFEDDCIASKTGVVYPNILKKINNNKYQNLDKSVLTLKEKTVIDNVIKYFGCYSGNILNNFSTKELPYLKAKGDLLYNDNTQPIIEKEDIFDYFVTIKSKYQMISISEIKKYSNDMFRNEIEF